MLRCSRGTLLVPLMHFSLWGQPLHWLQEYAVVMLGYPVFDLLFLSYAKFAGYGLCIHKGKGRLRIHPRSIQRLRDKIRETAARSNGMSIRTRKTKLNRIIRGWMNYFKLADAKSLLRGLDEWLRRRIRMVTWKQWKKVKTRFVNLKWLGIKDEQAWMWANIRRSYWRTAYSPILHIALSNKRLKQAGYLSLLECYSAK